MRFGEGTPARPQFPRPHKGARLGLLPPLKRRFPRSAEPSPAPRLTQPAPLLILRLLQPRPRSAPAAATAPRAVGVAATVAALLACSLTSEPAAVANRAPAAKRGGARDSPGKGEGREAPGALRRASARARPSRFHVERREPLRGRRHEETE